MNYPTESKEIYWQFKKQDGSREVGKPLSIDVCISVCKDKNPRRILELGGGIGTLSYAMLKHSNAHLDIYEQNEFCREKLIENLIGFEDRYTIIDTYEKLPPYRDYDFVVIDGGDPKDHRLGYAHSAEIILRYLNSVGHIYIEGRRGRQRMEARRALRDKGYVVKIIRHPDEFIDGKRYPHGQEIVPTVRNRVFAWGSFLFWQLLYYAMHGYRTLKPVNIKKKTLD